MLRKLTTSILLGILLNTSAQYVDLLVEEPDTLYLEEVSISVLPHQLDLKHSTASLFKTRVDLLPAALPFAVPDAINSAAGVNMAVGSPGTVRLTIRGIGSRTPYNTNRIRAYWDDIPLTTGDGVSTIEDLDLFAIGNIEILKGPGSSLYGAGLGGVVKLNSTYPRENGLRILLSGNLGTPMNAKYGGMTQYKSDNLAVVAGYTRTVSDRVRENSRYERDNLFLNTRLFTDKHLLSFTLSFIDLYAQIPSSVNLDAFQNTPYLAGGSWAEIGGYEAYTRLLAGLSMESTLMPNLKNKLILFGTRNDPYERRRFNILDDRSTSAGVRDYLELDLEQWNLQVGAEYFREAVNWKIFETLDQGQGAMESHHSEIRQYMNAFFSGHAKIGSRINLDAGVNFNLLQYDLNTLFNLNSLDQTGSYTYHPVLSPRLAVNYAITGDQFLYGSVGHGFSAPSLEETLMPEGILNTQLRPEAGWNIELGSRGAIWDRRINWDLTLYSMYVKDLLVTERLAEDQFTGKNAGKALFSGLDATLSASLLPDHMKSKLNIATNLNLSQNRFREFVDDGIDYTGNELPGIPSYLLLNRITLKRGNYSLSAIHNGSGKQWMNDANTEQYAGHQILHLLVAGDLSITEKNVGLKITGGIKNVFNTRYASMILVNAPSFGGRAPRYFYPAPPRSIFLGIILDLKDLTKTRL